MVSSDLRTITKVTFYSGIWNILGYIFTAISGILIAKLVGPEVLGTVTVGVSLATTLSIISVIGMDRGIIKYVAHFLGKGEFGLVTKPLKFAIIVSSIIAVAIIISYFSYFDRIIIKLFAKVHNVDFVFSAMIFLVPVLVLDTLYGSAIRGILFYQYVQFANGIIIPVVRVLFVFIFSLWLLNLTSLVAAIIVSYLIVLIFQIYVFEKKIKKKIIILNYL